MRLRGNHPSPGHRVDGTLHTLIWSEELSIAIPIPTVNVRGAVQEQFELAGFLSGALRGEVGPGRVEGENSARPRNGASGVVKGPRKEAGVHRARRGEEVQ